MIMKKKEKLKGIFESQSKHIGFKKSKKCLNAEEYQRESEYYILRSVNRNMYLQK